MFTENFARSGPCRGPETSNVEGDDGEDGEAAQRETTEAASQKVSGAERFL